MNLERNMGIYQIVNKVNGKYYIGSAINIQVRWNKHHSALCRGKHDNNHLQSAWNKYGEDAFELRVLELVPKKDWLVEIEQYWIDFLDGCDNDVGYNICPIAGRCLGLKRSEEARAKMSAAKIGRTLSEETRKKISIAHKGCLKSEETRAKMSAARKGWIFSDETKAKIGAAGKGRILSEEHKAKLIAANTGRVKSEEERAKISAALTGRFGRAG